MEMATAGASFLEKAFSSMGATVARLSDGLNWLPPVMITPWSRTTGIAIPSLRNRFGKIRDNRPAISGPSCGTIVSKMYEQLQQTQCPCRKSAGMGLSPRIGHTAIVEVIGLFRERMPFVAMDEKRRSKCQPRSRSLDRRYQKPSGILARPGMHDRDLQPAEAPAAGCDDLRNRLWPGDERQLAAGLHDGPGRAYPALEKPFTHRMRFRPQSIRRTAIRGVVE